MVYFIALASFWETTMSLTQQQLTELLADEFTAADLQLICEKFGLDLVKLTGDTRMNTAEAIVSQITAAGQLAELHVVMYKLRPEAFPDPAVESKGGLSIDIELELTEEEKAGAGGVLSAEGSPAVQAPDPKAPERVVNTGFSDEDNPSIPAKKAFPLYTDSRYYFWLEVGEVVEGSIDVEHVELDMDELPPEAKLQVVLFGFDGELALTKGQDVGELILQPDGLVRVANRVAEPADVDEELLGRRLFFPITTPADDGEYRLRCNIYYEQTLLQSRLVTAKVMEDPEPEKGVDALATEVDFVISKSLSGSHVAKMTPKRLSMMLNDNGNGTHGFRYFGQGNFKNDTSLDAGELQNLLDLARGALRNAAWGDEGEYNGQAYLYAGGMDFGRLKVDLIRCAIRGYRFYDVVINRLAGGGGKVGGLADMMLKPGQVQIASKQSARLVLPSAMIYDYPLDTGLKGPEFKLCAEFEKNLKAGTPLENTACFKGECPSHGDDDTVCPSGFWGFRHAIGMPVTIPNAPDAPVQLKIGAAPEISMAVSTDPAFEGRQQHEQRVKGLLPNLKFNYADERPEALDLMKNTSPHVLYFFCHGRVASDTPSIEVGPPKTRGISRDNLRSKRIYWDTVRPLVFINGCHTTALEPEKAIDLVGGFIDTSSAAGVIGTEITNFVPVAKLFAEECLKRFIVDGQTIGEAVRGGRLAVLQQGNPLGLMYVPYVMADLKLVA
jgi:hypothetical protein